MIIGTGTDIIEVARVACVCERNARFVETVFTSAEREYSAKNVRHPHMHLAAAWAAKEAFFKATNFRFAYGELEVAHEESGKPYFRFAGGLAEKVAGMSVHLTISHIKDYATATVVVEDSQS